MNNMIDDVSSVPWYRQGWPWFLISIPMVSVVLGILMITLALTTNNSLVVDDYYKEGKAINQRIERDQLASSLGLSALLHFDSDEGTLLTLTHQPAVQSPIEFVWPDTLQVELVHVTQASLDQRHVFKHLGGGRYLDNATTWPDAGRWRVHVQPAAGVADAAPDWRLVSDTLVIANKKDILVKSSQVTSNQVTSNQIESTPVEATQIEATPGE